MDNLTPPDFSGMSREYLAETLASETRENHRLRTLLLALASRPEITQETREWLSQRIRESGKEPIVRGLREDEMELVRGLHKWATRLANVTRKATELPEGEAPNAAWYRLADGAAEQVETFLQECSQQFGRTIQDLEEAR